MAEQNVKGGNVREVSLGSNETARPADKGGNLLARKDPLVDTQATSKRVSLLGGAVLSIGLAAFAFGCDDGKGADEIPDAGWDGGSECEDGCPDGGATDALLALCGEPGSELTDNEELIAVLSTPQHDKAVFSKSGRYIEAIEISSETPDGGETIETVVVWLAEKGGEPLDNGHYGYDEMTTEDPAIAIYGEPIVKLGLCGLETVADPITGNPAQAARIVTDRENGFVHCLTINSGADSVPVEHEIDASTVEVLVTHTHSAGEIAEDEDFEDCAPQTDVLEWQTLTFQDTEGNPTSLTSRNVLLFSDAQTLTYHELVDGLLQQSQVDLYEVDGVAGTLKIGTSKLGVGTLGIADFLTAGDQLQVTLNNFFGEVPEFSYAYAPDMSAEVWVTTTANPNELEVNVLSGEISKTYVVRFSNNKGDDTVDVTVLEKSALSVLGTGSETNLNGKVYTDAVDTDAAGVTKIKLTPTD